VKFHSSELDSTPKILESRSVDLRSNYSTVATRYSKRAQSFGGLCKLLTFEILLRAAHYPRARGLKGAHVDAHVLTCVRIKRRERDGILTEGKDVEGRTGRKRERDENTMNGERERENLQRLIGSEKRPQERDARDLCRPASGAP